jgi:hypothetical protein
MTEAASSKMTISAYETTQCYNPEHHTVWAITAVQTLKIIYLWCLHFNRTLLQPPFLGVNCNGSVAQLAAYTLCKPLSDVICLTLDGNYNWYLLLRVLCRALGINSVEISFSGCLGLSQTRLRITSQLFINNFTTLIICIAQFLKTYD